MNIADYADDKKHWGIHAHIYDNFKIFCNSVSSNFGDLLMAHLRAKPTQGITMSINEQHFKVNTVLVVQGCIRSKYLKLNSQE